jgi:hypothetical protein
MQWVVPDVPYRELDEDFRCEGGVGATHVRGPSDFCKSCGADLHVTRLRVKRVSYSDAWRLHICKAAWYSGPDCGEQAAEEELDRLGISTDDREKMLGLYLLGCEAYMYVLCGLRGAYHIVGITTDGMLLYAVPGEYEIGAETQLSY